MEEMTSKAKVQNASWGYSLPYMVVVTFSDGFVYELSYHLTRKEAVAAAKAWNERREL